MDEQQMHGKTEEDDNNDDKLDEAEEKDEDETGRGINEGWYNDRAINLDFSEHKQGQHEISRKQTKQTKLSTVTVSATIPIVNTKQNSMNVVKEWLSETVKLPQYFEMFLEQGFDDLMAIKWITVHSLKTIGVKNEDHIQRLLNAIRELQADSTVAV